MRRNPGFVRVGSGNSTKLWRYNDDDNQEKAPESARRPSKPHGGASANSCKPSPYRNTPITSENAGYASILVDQTLVGIHEPDIGLSFSIEPGDRKISLGPRFARDVAGRRRSGSVDLGQCWRNRCKGLYLQRFFRLGLRQLHALAYDLGNFCECSRSTSVRRRRRPLRRFLADRRSRLRANIPEVPAFAEPWRGRP
jgi:hypothetical protein